MPVREVDLSTDLLPRHREVFRLLGLLGRAIPADRWCLVGGLMVLVAGRLEGARDHRATQTKDGDILIDVVADPSALAAMVAECRTYGFDFPRHDWPDDEGFARCTLVAHSAQVDLLCPDDAAEHHLVAGGARSLAIPGGRRALEVAEPVTVLLGDDWAPVDVRVPTLYGALAVKAAAATDPHTRDQTRHLEDVAFLLSIVPDPRRLSEEVAESDLDLLRALAAELNDDSSPAWAHLDTTARLSVQAALGFL